MKLFFKPKKQPDAKEAILGLRENRDMLEKRESHLQTRINNEKKIARENATKNKQRAIAALKRKRMLEAQLEQITGLQMNVEQQTMAIESANINVESMKAMQQGSQAMKKIHQNFSIEKIEEVTDDIRDEMEKSKEIGQALSGGFGFVDIDEDELDAELEELEQEELDKQLLDAERAPVTLPQVPASAVRAQPASPAQRAQPQATDEEDELNELRESMGMLA
ncbi:ESCRT-III subunit protein snf7 [Coemansia sp. RSA 2706]|nr:ESCRT-III subunit protein snf7 [Coemansia sp. RSA 2711]KAJ1846629.1 ESCRT-III subunit protein snf7 [Coemansia sp. RSA 2708]KAJ2308990.1 ESCRT-III subunit protein snf7 [Coemansia sp. RSA 2706]KAJ2315709.1 ESCRT-III subunit protein snf7 [Coemansia sp. RSA 2705]KAJ2322426.1 ESCRT-III subunit protein snf7 [Coemansia sp. RSA 2704]KAJ2330212.1 ESCRT-III subunit protein snf7 [Coemansia sp. RSA 2702]KAJ2739973.1 ESCRT-III subunit protein snf7 [Coemansia sp. Cherry 401B]